MKLTRTRLAAIVAELADSGMTTKALSQEIAAYLLSEGRTGELESVLRDVMQYRADHGTVEVIATDAHAIDDRARRDIESVVRELYPKATTIIISEQRDADVVGGIRLELANQQLDLSVRATLNRFKQLTVTAGGA